MNDRLFWISIGVSLIIYLCIIEFSTMYYWIKNSHNKPILCEKDGMLLVGIYDGSIKMRRYGEFSFVQKRGKYSLSQESRKEFIKGIVYGNAWALLFLLIPTVILFASDSEARIALPGLIVAIASMITISIETEMYQYIKCKKFINTQVSEKEEAKVEYVIQGRRLVWEYDELNNDASRFKDNNLYIAGIWNMKDTVGYTDTCVGLSVPTDDSFYFVTFGGVGFTMKITGNNVECIRKQITK